MKAQISFLFMVSLLLAMAFASMLLYFTTYVAHHMASKNESISNLLVSERNSINGLLFGKNVELFWD